MVGRGPTKLEIEHLVASGHARHQTWRQACLRPCGIAGRHERREPGREDEDPLVAIDCGYLKRDGTEDDDDDDDDETTHSGVKLEPLRETGVSVYATSWLVSLLRRLGVSQSDIAK